MFSIIIITRDRLTLLQKCLKSLEVFRHTLKFELIVVLNGVDPQTHAYLNDYSGLTLIYTSDPLTPGAARNLALKSVTREWTFFIDDDAQVPPDYFSYALKLIKDIPRAQIIGGSDTFPPDTSGLALATSLALESPFCTGATSSRHSQKTMMPYKVDETSLTSCNLWVRSHWWLKGISFPEDYIRGEETILLKQISLQTDELWLAPSLKVWHQRRDELWKMTKASYKGGYYRAKSLVEMGGAKWFWLAPLFVLLHFSIVAMPPFFVISSLTWLVIVISISIVITLRHKKLTSLPLVVFLHWLILFSYGLGFIKFQIDRWGGGE